MADNVLAQRRQPTPTSSQRDPMAALQDLARQAGYKGSNLKEAMDAAWSASPTDGVGELIDMVARKTGVSPPWANQQQQNKPPARPSGGPAYQDPYEPY